MTIMEHRGHKRRPVSCCSSCRKGFQQIVLRWGDDNHRSFPWRRPSRSSYELVLAEILLQQTRAEQVARVFSVITNHCPDWSALLEVPEAELENLLRPLGLQRRRAIALRALARTVIKNGLPIQSCELEKLPGIGQYIARAISTQLSMEVVAPIDGNVTRVLERVFGPRKLSDIRHDPWLQNLALRLVPLSNPDTYFVALLDFAAMVCRPRIPKCDECPIADCRFRTSSMEL